MPDQSTIIVPQFHYGLPDIYDGTPWSADDLADLRAAIGTGSTPKEAARHLCRAGTVDEVKRKAAELGLEFREQ